MAAAGVFQQANLSEMTVDAIWELCDIDGDGQLDEDEFVLALHVAAARFRGVELPDALPDELLPPSKKAAGEKRKEKKKRFSLVKKKGDKGDAPEKETKKAEKGKKQKNGAAAAPAAAPPPPPPPELGPGAPGAAEGPPTMLASEANLIRRTGTLSKNGKKRWCALFGGELSLYETQKSSTPKLVIAMGEVAMFKCADMKSFSITLGDSGGKGKGGKARKAGETIVFSADSAAELSAWAKDLTEVWRALSQPQRSASE